MGIIVLFIEILLLISSLYASAFYAFKFAKSTDCQTHISALFTLSMSLISTLCYLMILEITDNMEHGIREMFWYLFLWANIMLMSMVVPLYQIYFLIPDRFSSDQMYYGLFGFCYLCYIGFVWVFGSIGVAFSSQLSLLENIICRLGFLGLIMMSCISGFASSNIILSYFGFLIQTHDAETIRDKERKLANLQDDIYSLKCDINNAQEDVSRPSGGLGGLMNRISSTFRISSSDQLVLTLAQKELEASDLSKELDGLIVAQRNDSNSNILVTRISKSALAWYCVLRIFTSLYGSFAPYSAYRDPVSMFLSIIASIVHSNFDQSAWSQVLSIILATSIMSSSSRAVRPILRRLLNAFEDIDLNDFGILSLAQFVNAYSFANLLLLKLSLPLSRRPVITKILSGIDLGFFGQWFERLFLASFIISFLYFYLFRRS